MKAKTKKALAVAMSVPALGALAVSKVFAACPAWTPSVLCSEEGTQGHIDIQSIIKLALYIIIAAGVLWSLWNIIRAGFEYSSAGDDAEKKKKSTQRIITAVIGLVIVVMSFTILSLVSGWFTKSSFNYSLNTPCITEDGKAGSEQNTAGKWQCCELDSTGSPGTPCNDLP